MMGLLWTATSIWALIGAGVLLSMAGDRYFHATFFEYGTYLLMFFGPLAALVWFVMQRAEGRNKAQRDAMAAGGVTPGMGLDHTEKDSGIGVNPTDKTVTLRNGAFWKTYAFADVREWETLSRKPGHIVGVGVQGSLQALGANAGEQMRAAAASGLFLTVRDVESPRWRVEMKDPATQDRWMEILRQHINES